MKPLRRRGFIRLCLFPYNWGNGPRSILKEALIKSTCADLRQKFSLARKKIAEILADFKIF